LLKLLIYIVVFSQPHKLAKLKSTKIIATGIDD